jgi:hypothetical protein
MSALPKDNKDKIGYSFDPTRHIHLLEGRPLMGVTTVLGVISKGNVLIDWSARMATEYIRDNLKSMDDLEMVLEEAKNAHRKKKERAGDWGTALHKIIEDFIKDGKEPLNLDDNQGKCFSLFKSWATENNVEFLESEKHVYSKTDWVGGIADIIAVVNGKKMICDIKTGSGIYPEMWAQMGAYHLCLEDMGEHKDIQGYMIINLKKDAKIDFGVSENMQFNKDFFRAALQLYKLKQIADESI